MNPHANLLLVCATKVESKAILEVFQSASNKASEPTSIADRMYHNLGLINNTTVFMMQCEMGAAGQVHPYSQLVKESMRFHLMQLLWSVLHLELTQRNSRLVKF